MSYRNVSFRHAIGFDWTSDQPVAKASTYTAQHNTQTNIHAPTAIRTHDHRNQAAKTHALDSAATGTGREHLQIAII
jgi:hypothetical protein